MAELFFFIVSLLCLFGSVEASLFFMAIAGGIVAVKRANLDKKLDEAQEAFDKSLALLKDEVAESRTQLRSLRTEYAASSQAASQAVTTSAPRADAAAAAPAAEEAPVPKFVASVQAPAPATPQAPEPKPVVAEPQRPAAPLTQPPAQPKPVVPQPVVPRPSAPVHPPVMQAAHSVPTGVAPLRITVPPVPPAPSRQPAKPFGERLKSALALEEVLGTNWLNKLGIIILVLGVALFGIYELGQLGPAGKVLLSFGAGAGLLVGGAIFERRERYRVLGRTIIGGGWALLFFTSYAMYHVAPMRLLLSETADVILMLAVAVGMALHTLRYRSQVVTGLAFLLGYSTIALSHDTVYSLSAGAILAVGLVILVIKMNWFELEVFGILSSYLNHLYWLYKILGPEGANHRRFAEFWASTSILLLYWLVYRVSYVIRKTHATHEEHVSTFAALANTLLLLAVMKFQSARPELAFYALLALGMVEFVFGQLPITRRRRIAFVILSTLGAVLMIAAVPFRYSGGNVALLWMVGAEVFLVAGIVLKEKVFRRLGLLAGLAAALHVVIVDAQPFLQQRLNSETPLFPSGVLFLTLGALFYLNSQVLGRRWVDMFDDSFESGVMLLHSYIGAITISTGVWAVLAGDWTALGWATLILVLAFAAGKLEATHLFVHASVLGAVTLARALVVNLRDGHDPLAHAHRLIVVPLLAAVYYLSAKFISKLEYEIQTLVRDLFAWAGTALAAVLIWREFSAAWVVVGWAALALLLVEATRLLKYRALLWHVHALAVAFVARTFVTNSFVIEQWHGTSVRLLTMLAVAAAAYVLAARIRTSLQIQFSAVSSAYTWAAASLIATLIWFEVPAPWIAASWAAFGLALTLIARRLKLGALCYQENALALAAVIRVVIFNYSLERSYGHFTLRLITVSLVAATLYIASRRSFLPELEDWRPAAYLHTWAATGLLAALAWYEAPNVWLAVLWAVFALCLAVIDRRFEVSDLRWQAHSLALLAAVRIAAINLHVTATLRGVSLRLISVTIVVLILYALARLVRMPEEFRHRDIHHVYSWTASALASVLMWYELQPLSVAVAWGIFGLLLVEIGLLRKSAQLRFQGYVALASAFVRIFFANLAVATVPGDRISPRILTVVPLAVIIYFVYSQLVSRNGELIERRARVDVLLCYAGTITISALLYFQLMSRADWIVAAWAGLIFVLFAVALILRCQVFLHQGLLLALAALSRGVFHNLFGASYFIGSNWTGRYAVLGSATAVMFLTLPFAFRLRQQGTIQARTRLRRFVSALASHPEQIMFFVPIVLLTLMLALKLESGMVTVAWGIEAVLIVVLALAAKERSYRLTGLALLLVCVGKIMLMDAWRLGPRDRYITLIILGAALLTVSFLYTRYREAIRQLL